MRWAHLITLATALFLALTSSLVQAADERRVALVIGNSQYESVARLPNTQPDADLIASSLREAGFTSVNLSYNLTRERLISALQRFASEAEKADWAVIYYAGHGIEMSGMNYLIPTDAKLKTDRDLQFEAVPLTQVLGAVEGARKLKLVVLDACRDNPFVASMTRSLGATRSIGRGLAQVEPEAGTLVAYAAKHGQVASDGDGGHSPFVISLAKHIATPGLEISRLFRRVTSDVLVATNRRQEPFTYGSLPDEDFYFRSPAVVVPEARQSEATAASVNSITPNFKKTVVPIPNSDVDTLNSPRPNPSPLIDQTNKSASIDTQVAPTNITAPVVVKPSLPSIKLKPIRRPEASIRRQKRTLRTVEGSGSRIVRPVQRIRPTNTARSNVRCFVVDGRRLCD